MYLQNEYKVRVDTEPRQSHSRTNAERDGIISIYKVNNSNREHTINDLMDAACCCHENRDLRIKYHSAINHDGTIYQIKLIIPEQLLSKLNDLNETIKKDTETANCQIANRNLPGSDERVVVIESDSRRELRSILKKFVSVLIDNKKGLVEYRVVFLGMSGLGIGKGRFGSFGIVFGYKNVVLSRFRVKTCVFKSFLV